MSRTQDMKGYGYFLGVAERALEAAGSPLKGAEKEAFYTAPKEAMASLYRRMAACWAVTPAVEAEIGAALELVEGDDYGTKEHPISIEDMGVLILAHAHYDKERMSVKEAAEKLGVSVQRVYQMVDEGKLDGFRVKGRMELFSGRVRIAAEAKK